MMRKMRIACFRDASRPPPVPRGHPAGLRLVEAASGAEMSEQVARQRPQEPRRHLGARGDDGGAHACHQRLGQRRRHIVGAGDDLLAWRFLLLKLARPYPWQLMTLRQSPARRYCFSAR